MTRKKVGPIDSTTSEKSLAQIREDKLKECAADLEVVLQRHQAALVPNVQISPDGVKGVVTIKLQE